VSRSVEVGGDRWWARVVWLVRGVVDARVKERDRCGPRYAGDSGGATSGLVAFGRGMVGEISSLRLLPVWANCGHVAVALTGS
jgi:hypothetical protein